jgi:hypothetical protein
MAEIQITYEIERRDFAEANAAIHRASRRSQLDLCGILGSALLLLFLPFAYRESGTGWMYPYLVVPFAAYLLYLSILWVSPFLSAIVGFRRPDIAGKKYEVHFSPSEVRVSGEYVVWIHQWPSFRIIREAKNLFLFYDGITMYIFAKRYFTVAQMEDLRQLIKNAQAGRASAN